MPQAGAATVGLQNERDELVLNDAAEQAAVDFSADQTLSLQLSSGLPVSTETGEGERDLLRLMYRTLRGRDVQIDNQLALAEMLLQMERDAGQLQAKAQQVEESEPVPPPPALVPAVPDERFDLSELLALLDFRAVVASGGLLLLLMIIWYRRVGTSSLAAAPQIEKEDSEEAVQEPGLGQHVQESDLDQETVLSLDVPPEPEPTSSRMPAHLPNRVPYRWQALLMRPATLTEGRQLSDLAEIILSVGQVQGADALLRRFVETSPKLALELWIRLLENRREQGKKAEFETLSKMLNQHFNVECVPWDEVRPAEHLEVTLQLLPHIRDQVDSTWGHPECLDYLLRLLLNNRGGERHGFSLSVTKEILILIDLIAAETDGRKVQA